jgi:hypothetical protein
VDASEQGARRASVDKAKIWISSGGVRSFEKKLRVKLDAMSEFNVAVSKASTRSKDISEN